MKLCVGFTAANRAIEMARIDKDQIGDCGGYHISNACIPSAACQIQSMLGIKKVARRLMSRQRARFHLRVSIADQYVKSARLTHAGEIKFRVLARARDHGDRGTIVFSAMAQARPY